jgi:hypothetical protein
MSLPGGALAGIRQSAGEVGFGKAELAGAGLAPFNEPAPTPVFQANLQGLADQLVRGAVIFFRRRLYFRQQPRRDKGLAGDLGFHIFSTALPVEKSTEAVFSML